jgi:hypothetical protein
MMSRDRPSASAWSRKEVRASIYSSTTVTSTAKVALLVKPTAKLGMTRIASSGSDSDRYPIKEPSLVLTAGTGKPGSIILSSLCLLKWRFLESRSIAT